MAKSEAVGRNLEGKAYEYVANTAQKVAMESQQVTKMFHAEEP
jgi:hypothetical protein